MFPDSQTHAGGVSCVRIVLQHAWQTEVWDLAHQITVDQNVPGSQVPVDVPQISQVSHASCYATQNPNQLNDVELTVMSLFRGKRNPWSLASAHREVQQGNAKLQRYTRTNTNMFTHPQERVQRAVLHVLCDDHYRFALVENTKTRERTRGRRQEIGEVMQVWMKRFSIIYWVKKWCTFIW